MYLKYSCITSKTRLSVNLNFPFWLSGEIQTYILTNKKIDYEVFKLPASTILTLFIQDSSKILNDLYYLFCSVKAANDHLREFGEKRNEKLFSI